MQPCGPRTGMKRTPESWLHLIKWRGMVEVGVTLDVSRPVAWMTGTGI